VFDCVYLLNTSETQQFGQYEYTIYKEMLVCNNSLAACIEEGVLSLLTFPGYSTSVWCTSGCLLWFWFVELEVGTLGNVSLCGLLVEST
jgi:hypothetical protein